MAKLTPCIRQVLLLASLVLLCLRAHAQPITYQGMLKEAGIPATGAYDFQFLLFTAASGGSQVGATLTVNDHNVQFGLFSVELNFGNVWDGSERYLEIRVRAGASTGAYTTLSPRVKMNPTPYAIWASKANPIGSAGGDLSGTYPNPAVARLQGRAVSSTAPTTGQVLKWDGTAWAPGTDLTDALWQVSGSNIYYTAGNVGIGTASRGDRLHVETSIVGWGAVYGNHTATSGGAYGVWGQSASTSGTGVFGHATATSGTTYGGLFESASTDGRGVVGWATATRGTTYGGWFGSASTSGTGVVGHATATSGITYGVYGQSDSTSGRGVVGYAGAPTTNDGAYGVWGQSDSTNGTGVFGLATATSGYTYGVWGRSESRSGYGVYSEGRFAASGTKSFQMDHPLRPETHYLNHFCTEAPDPMNAYSGNVTTDAQGYAVVQLPDYFESINRDFRYQLTVIDASDDFVLAKVVRKIQNNRFVIRTSKPFVEVSWEVKAIRNDHWVQQYGYQTEQEKPRELQGKYLNPELYGQPKELGIHYRPEPEPARDTPKRNPK